MENIVTKSSSCYLLIVEKWLKMFPKISHIKLYLIKKSYKWENMVQLERMWVDGAGNKH